MREHLTPNCDIERWTDLDQQTKLKYELQAMDDPLFFWDNECMGNMKLWPSQKRVLREFYEIEDNKRKYNEFLFDAGMRGGKTTVAALILCTELYRLLLLKSPQKHYGLIDGDTITLYMTAAGEKQTLRTIFPRVRVVIENSPYLSSYHELVDLTSGRIKFPKNIIMEAVGSNLKTAVGRTVKCLVAEEVNSVGTADGQLKPADLYNKLSKSTTTFMPYKEDIRVAISSKTSGYDFLSIRIQETREKKLKSTYIVQANTLELNPNVTKEAIAEEILRDEDSANMDYGIGEALGGNRFFRPIILDKIKLSKKNIFTIPKITEHDMFVPDFLPFNFELDTNYKYYIMGLDPSTINDPFGISIAHVTNNNEVIVDGTTVFRSNKKTEINPELVNNLLTKVIETIPISYCIFDIYMYNETRQRMMNAGIEHIKHILNLPDWNLCKDYFAAGMVTIPDEEYIKRELKELIITTGGKIDHPSSGSKDALDSICQCVTFPLREENDKLPQHSLIGGIACQYR